MVLFAPGDQREITGAISAVQAPCRPLWQIAQAGWQWYRWPCVSHVFGLCVKWELVRVLPMLGRGLAVVRTLWSSVRALMLSPPVIRPLLAHTRDPQCQLWNLAYRLLIVDFFLIVCIFSLWLGCFIPMLIIRSHLRKWNDQQTRQRRWHQGSHVTMGLQGAGTPHQINFCSCARAQSCS